MKEKDTIWYALKTIPFIIFILSCETPNSPDFTLQQSVSSPVLLERTYPFLGGPSAIIDTTSADLDSLFSIDSQGAFAGMARISQQISFNVGSLNNAIPVIEVDPTSADVTLGLIEINDFTSSLNPSVGVLEKSPLSTAPLGLDFVLPAGNIPPSSLSPTSTPALQIADPSFSFAVLELTSRSPRADTNKISFRFINNLDVPLTNGSITSAPAITIVNANGDVLAEAVPFLVNGFAGTSQINPSQTGVADVFLDGERLTSNLAYNLDFGTPGGSSSGGTFSLTIEGGTTLLRLQRAFASLDPQPNIALSDQAEVQGDFVQAQIANGLLILDITNETEFDLTIDQLRIFNTNAFKAKNTGVFFAAGSEIGVLDNLSIGAGQTLQEQLDLSGKGIGNEISMEGNANAVGANSQILVDAGDNISIDVLGSLTVESATAVLNPQDFSSTESFDFTTDDVSFEDENDQIRLSSGEIAVSVINNIDLDIDTLRISFPTIFVPDNTGFFTEADTLTVEFSDSDRIRRRSVSGVLDQRINLSGMVIKAPNNLLEYHVFGSTENTRLATGSDSTRTVRASDFISLAISVNNLEFSEVTAVIEPDYISLGNDVNEDLILDIQDENEVSVSKISDLGFLSERLDSIIFNNPTFNLFYTSNLGTDATIYAAIQGIDEKGNALFLAGILGSPLQVANADTVTGFLSGGIEIPKSSLVKFDLESTGDAELIDRVILFDETNSNVGAFLSNLPTTIRLIAKAAVNSERKRGRIRNPILFETDLGVDIPFNFSTIAERPAIIEDTTKANLSDLPDPDDEADIQQAEIIIQYSNTLPLGLTITLEFLRETEGGFDVVTTVPQSGQANLELLAAPIDPDSRFSNGAAEGAIRIPLSEQQLDVLNQTRQLRLAGSAISTNNQEVRIRANDGLTLKVIGQFEFSVEVN